MESPLLFFSDFLLYFNNTFLIFIHVSSDSLSSCIFIAERHNFSVLLLMDVCVVLILVYCNCCHWCFVHVLWWPCLHLPSIGCIHRSRIVGSEVCNLHFHQQITRPPMLPLPCQYMVCQSFGSLVRVLCYLIIVLIFTYLITNEIDHIFTFINNLEFLICEAPIQVFALILLGRSYMCVNAMSILDRVSCFFICFKYYLILWLIFSFSHLLWSTEVPNFNKWFVSLTFMDIAFWDVFKMSFSNLKVKVFSYIIW